MQRITCILGLVCVLLAATETKGASPINRRKALRVETHMVKAFAGIEFGADTPKITQIHLAIDLAAAGKPHLTRCAARTLSPELRAIYGKVVRQMRSSLHFDMAQREPFPEGQINQFLVFNRYLPMLRKRIHYQAIQRFHILEDLRTLRDRIVQGDVALSGVKLTPRDDKVILTIPAGERSAVTVVLWKHGFEIPGDVSLKYRERSAEEELAVLAGKAIPHPNYWDRVDGRLSEGTDWTLMQRIALALDRALHNNTNQIAIRDYFERWGKRHDAVISSYLSRRNAVRFFRQLAETVTKKGTLVLGDADLFVSIEDKLVQESSSGRKKTLIKNQGKLLVVHSAASSADFAIRLDPLVQGTLQAFTFDESDRGEVHVSPAGKALSMSDFRTMFAFAYLLDRIPAAHAEFR